MFILKVCKVTLTLVSFFIFFFPNSIEVGILRSRGCYIKFPEASEVIVLSGGVSFCDSSNRRLDAFVNRRKTSK